ncbi:hypothetical protein C9975_02995 [Thalassospira xiamenensis]|nr:hypothetical protein C9975_02995 [Thalassospira xiamenensis]
MTKLNFGVAEAKAKAKELADNASLDIKSGACLISVDVQGACGERTLADSKSMLDGEVLESNLLSGTKLRWFPNDELRFVSTKSNAVRRVLAQSGIKFANGATLIPISSLPDVIEDLEKLKGEFEEHVTDVYHRYAGIIAEHKRENADIERHIDKCVEESEKFCGRFIFKVHSPMAIQPLFDGDEDNMASTAAETLLDEVAAEANRIWAKSLSGAERATFKKTRPVLSLRDKLLNLSFLDPRIQRVALKFDEVMDSLPKTYPIEGGDFHKLASFVLLCSDPEKLASYGDGGDELDSDANDIDAADVSSETLPEASMPEPETESNATLAPTLEADLAPSEPDEANEVNEDESNEEEKPVEDDDFDVVSPQPANNEQTPQGGFVFDGW